MPDQQNYLLSTLSDVAISKTDDTDKTKLRSFTDIANSGLPFSYYGERTMPTKKIKNDTKFAIVSQGRIMFAQ